jgi:hypothetical protein
MIDHVCHGLARVSLSGVMGLSHLVLRWGAPLGLALAVASPVGAQGPGTDNGQWQYRGSDDDKDATQITAANFEDPEVVKQWDAGSFRSSMPRAAPTSYSGKRITVTGDRRYVVALDPARGEFVWSFSVPRPGELGHDTREDDAWLSWAPTAADQERNSLWPFYLVAAAAVLLFVFD